MKSTDAHMELVRRYLSGEATRDEVETLDALMLDDDQLRADFLAYARVDAALPSAVGEKDPLVVFDNPSSQPNRWLLWAPMAAVFILGLVLAIQLGQLGQRPATAADRQVVAEFGQLDDCSWMNPADGTDRIQTGDPIRDGQRIELSSGTAEILYNTGAKLKLVGPAVIEAHGDNSSFLSMGEAHIVAGTPESKGFALKTPYTTFIDISTAFSATVSPDGLSRLEVTEGEVDAVLHQKDKPRRLRAGETLYVEPGKQKIITHLEPGENTPAFRFPNIEPPSNKDYADQAFGRASIKVLDGESEWAHDGVNPADILFSGAGQPNRDSPRESAFFRYKTGRLLIDLGQPISISKINSYSWHQHPKIKTHTRRAQQSFVLYGYAGDELPAIPELREEGTWTRIARVNSDQFFKVNEELQRPAQQACSITSSRGEIGTYRYLLINIRHNIFLGEIDIYGTP